MGKILSTKTFIVSHTIILIATLIFLGGIYYIINQGYPQKILQNYNPVTKTPSSFNLEISHPDNETHVFDKNIIISGKSIPHASIIITNALSDIGLEANNQGEFSKVITLEEGLNSVSITAFDEFGNSKSEERVIYFSSEASEDE